ncbi:MAG: hypothetical protein ACT4NY_18750 [Pseudonocardiales bacterium]
MMLIPPSCTACSRSVALYLREFDRLRTEAAYDKAAYALIDRFHVSPLNAATGWRRS